MGAGNFLDANAHSIDTLHIECQGSEGPLEAPFKTYSRDINLIREVFGNGYLGRVSSDKRPLYPQCTWSYYNDLAFTSTRMFSH